MRSVLTTLSLLTVIAASILQATLDWTGAGLCAAAALALYLLLEGWRTQRNGRVILVMSVAAGIAALTLHPDPLPLMLKAAVSAGTVIGLIAALGFLREAAESSSLVQACGQLMVRQPPGRRYLVLSLGSHLIALVLNFGVLPLLGTMIDKGNTAEAAGGDARIVAIRARRMLSAILRGFAVQTIWSPLSVSFAVTTAVVPGLPWAVLLPVQIGLAGLLLALGWYLDRRAFPPQRPATRPEPSNWRPLWGMSALVGAVIVCAIALAEALGLRPVVGAMVVVPPAAIIWLSVQHRAALPMLATLRTRLLISMPAFRDEVAMLGGAMFVGTIAAAFIPPHHTAQLISSLALPPVVLIIVLAWAVMVLAQLGVSQIVTVTLLGGALADMGAQGIHPLVLASGLMGAWGLSSCSTPVGAAVLTIARIARVPVATVARDWNGRFIVTGAVLLALWLVSLSLAVDLLSRLG